METVRFYFNRISPDMCRIVPVDIRSQFRLIADGGCICDIETLLNEMNRITAECEKIGFSARFEV